MNSLAFRSRRSRSRSNRVRPFLTVLPTAWVSVATGALPIVRAAAHQVLREAKR
ncbi:hypothetical protein [Nocardiopsis dassonvillei]|uniref:hypothetical protein n=1 Tax=Nocardiopsis dassonvillei TaxID=2014 RepID=UPI0036705472